MEWYGVVCVGMIWYTCCITKCQTSGATYWCLFQTALLLTTSAEYAFYWRGVKSVNKRSTTHQLFLDLTFRGNSLFFRAAVVSHFSSSFHLCLLNPFPSFPKLTNGLFCLCSLLFEPSHQFKADDLRIQRGQEILTDFQFYAIGC